MRAAIEETPGEGAEATPAASLRTSEPAQKAIELDSAETPVQVPELVAKRPHQQLRRHVLSRAMQR